MRDLIGIRLALSVAAGLIAVGLAATVGYPSRSSSARPMAVSGRCSRSSRRCSARACRVRCGSAGSPAGVRPPGGQRRADRRPGSRRGGAVAVLCVPDSGGICNARRSLCVLSAGSFRCVRPSIPRAGCPPTRNPPFAAAIAVSVLYFRVGVIAMSLLASNVQTGYFAASFRVIEVRRCPSLIAGYRVPDPCPNGCAAHHARLHTRRAGSSRWRSCSGRSSRCSLMLGARPVIDILGGAEFAPSIPVLRIQGLALIATCVAVSAGYVLLALRRHRAILDRKRVRRCRERHPLRHA